MSIETTIDSNFEKELKSSVKNKLGTEIIEIIKLQLNSDLKNNITAKGVSQPIKKPSTKKQYAKRGYDTENWLVRRGKSTELVFTITDNSIEIVPAGIDILRYHLQEALDWFSLSDGTINKSIEILNRN